MNITGDSGVGGAKGANSKERRAKSDWTMTQSIEAKSSGLARLHVKAKQASSLQFNNLLHHITPELLKKAYFNLNRSSAKGVDGESWKAFGQNLDERLNQLHQSIHQQTYQPQVVQRVWIPKPNGDKRPLGLTTVTDKVVQQAIVWVMEGIYESDFLGFSYGFRPNRNQHKALDAVYVAITQRKVSWVLDADISKFFDNIDHDWLMKFLRHRIADKRLLRLINQIIKAGVFDEGQYSKAEIGTPQGAVLSPLLANIYLHYVLDLWVDQWRKKRARGECYIVRYADDTLFGFQYRSDGEHFQFALNQRLEKFGLSINRDKTRLLEFGRFAAQNRRQRKQGKPETFVFLGFTHICSTKRSNGRFKLKRRTCAKKQKVKLSEIRKHLYKIMNKDVYAQGRWLRRVIIGHNNYYGVPENGYSLYQFRSDVCRAWLKALRRRGQKRPITWRKLTRLLKHFIPYPTIVHPYPSKRLCV